MFEAKKKIREKEAEDQGKGIRDKDYIKGVSDGFAEINIRSNYFDIILQTDKVLFIDACPVGKADKKRIEDRIETKYDKTDKKGSKKKNGPKDLVFPV
jgi:hypothetical protein